MLWCKTNSKLLLCGYTKANTLIIYRNDVIEMKFLKIALRVILNHTLKGIALSYFSLRLYRQPVLYQKVVPLKV